MLKKIIILLFFFFPSVASAELSASVSVIPTYPSAYQKVVLTLSSYSFDVNVAMISWSSGNKVLLSGLGKKSLSLSMGNVGQVIPISYKAVTSSGESVSGSLSLTPQSVDLVYESKESYVPPFYEGKALPGEGSIIRVTALPSLYEGTNKISSDGLAYSWYVNGEYLEKASGVGKQSANIGMEYLTSSTDVRVLVRSPRGNVAEKSISIHPSEIKPLLYPYDDVLGTDYTKPIFRRMEIVKDVVISLEPFYFSKEGQLEGTSLYSWYLDGLPITPREKTLLALRPAANTSGVKALTITLENSKRLLQKAQTNIEVIFDARN